LEGLRNLGGVEHPPPPRYATGTHYEIKIFIHNIYTQYNRALYTYINVHRREPALEATVPPMFMVWPRAWISGRLLWTQ